MKVLLLADPNSTHIIKWAKSLVRSGVQISIFGLTAYDKDVYADCQGIKIFTAGIEKSNINTNSRDLYKIFKYLTIVLQLKKVIRETSPDIVHAHMASSYGLLGSLACFSPYILSVWGHDVFKFPRKSLLHKAALKLNLGRADVLLSTSYAMAEEAMKYTVKEFVVTPFGVDLERFKPARNVGLFDAHDIVIGTVKSLDGDYGIDHLIRAFAILKNRSPQASLKLLIVGSGELEGYLRELAVELGVSDETVFTGQVKHQEVMDYHNMMSMEVFLSNSESFGVSVLEASACGKPVIVSNVGGLPEVVVDGETGFIVPPQDPEKAADAMEVLVVDVALREKIGAAGRYFVQANYNWDENVRQMVSIYKKTLRVA